MKEDEDHRSQFGKAAGAPLPKRAYTDMAAAKVSRLSRFAALRKSQRNGYRTAILFSHAFSLLLLVAIAHMPPREAATPGQWHAQPAEDEHSFDYMQVVEVTERSAEAAGEPGDAEVLPVPDVTPADIAPDAGGDGDAEGQTAVEDFARRLLSQASPLAPFIPSPAELTATAQLIPDPELPGSESIDQPPYLHSTSIRVHYPPSARRAGIEGRVIVHFLVDAEGQTSSAQVVESLHPLCDAAAITAVNGATFDPGRHEGKSVAAFARIAIRFVLD